VCVYVYVYIYIYAVLAEEKYRVDSVKISLLVLQNILCASVKGNVKWRSEMKYEAIMEMEKNKRQ
jgi:hypothetical protein